MDNNFELARFREALMAHAGKLPIATYWRYTNGLLPAFGRFIVERPELARALAADAEELAKQRKEGLPIIAAERATTQ